MNSFEKRVSLVCHPATPSAAIDAVDVAVSGGAQERLAFTYSLRGRLAALRVPEPRPAARADELWRHTCCEAFLGRTGETSYRELNFSPSGEWADYAFRAYREPDRDAAPLAAPRISLRRADDALFLTALLPAGAPFPRPGVRLEVGLAAVVEDSDGALSYWALRHPADRPDFHLRRSFALGLADPATTRSAEEAP